MDRTRVGDEKLTLIYRHLDDCTTQQFTQPPTLPPPDDCMAIATGPMLAQGFKRTSDIGTMQLVSPPSKYSEKQFFKIGDTITIEFDKPRTLASVTILNTRDDRVRLTATGEENDDNLIRVR